MAKNSVVVSCRRFEDEFGSHGVKFLRLHNGQKETRTYKNLTYSSYWRMVNATDKLYDDLNITLVMSFRRLDNGQS